MQQSTNLNIVKNSYGNKTLIFLQNLHDFC